MVEFAPAFGAIVVEAVVAKAVGWSLELIDPAGHRLGAVRITEATRDGFLALRVVSEKGFAQRQGRVARAALLDEAGALVMSGDCGRRGSGAWLELRTVDIQFGAPIEIAGTLRW